MHAAHDTPSAAGRHWQRMAVVLVLTGAYTVVEIAGGLWTGSLALLADAAHMFTDVFGLGIALFAIWLGAKPATPRHTFGYYRAEILAAFLNSMALFGVAGYVLYEAWRRFQDPPEILSLPMLAIAGVGLLINLAGLVLLHEGAGESLNVRGAFLEVLSDLLGSVAVILAGLIVHLTGWWQADPLFSMAIAVFIVPRTWHLLTSAVGILLEGTPSHLDLAQLRAAMESVPGVTGVHDLHAWSVTSGYIALSAHVHVQRDAIRNEVLSAVNGVLKDRFGIDHTTIQTEDDDFVEASVHL